MYVHFSVKRLPSFYHFLRGICDPPKKVKNCQTIVLYIRKHIRTTLKGNTEKQRASHFSSCVKKKERGKIGIHCGENGKEEKYSKNKQS